MIEWLVPTLVTLVAIAFAEYRRRDRAARELVKPIMSVSHELATTSEPITLSLGR